MADYPPPVNKLLTLGDPRRAREWPDYHQFGLGPEHIADLIGMVTDPAAEEADSENPIVWAPLHAWRALGQLRAAEAIPSLLTLLHRQDDEDKSNDWVASELPRVFGMIGPAALTALADLMDDTSRGMYARAAAADGLNAIAKAHPETRDACVRAITRVLESATANDPTLNGFLLNPLLDLQAVEAAPVIERAFAADAVDESIAGDWQDVQWELGLTDSPPQRTSLGPPLLVYPGGLGSIERPPRDQTAKAKAKAKRKQAAKSRKRNRKRR